MASLFIDGLELGLRGPAQHGARRPIDETTASADNGWSRSAA